MAEHDLETPVRALLAALDPEPAREGLLRTPERVARALAFLTRGYEEDPRAVIGTALFTEDYSEMILVKDIDFYSLCEHHILPFVGKAHVAYIPRSHIVGISKIARLVEVFARRLQVQERMTTQIAGTISELLNPLGVAVVLEAEHLCLRLRGARSPAAAMKTITHRGLFAEDAGQRQEVLAALQR